MSTLSYVEKTDKMPMKTHRQTSTKSTKKDIIELIHQQQQQIKHQESHEIYRGGFKIVRDKKNNENNKNRSNTHTSKGDIFRRARKKHETTLKPIPENLMYGNQEEQKSKQTKSHNSANQLIKHRTKTSQSRPPDMTRASAERQRKAAEERERKERENARKAEKKLKKKNSRYDTK